MEEKIPPVDNIQKTKTNYLKIFLPYIIGGLASFIISTTYFYKVLTPRYNENLTRMVDEKQQKIDNLTSAMNTKPNSDNSETNYCVDQVYNWENVKEHYALKILENKWVKFSSDRVGISFEYPIESNKLVLFEFNDWPKRDSDPSGIEFSWSTRELGEKLGDRDFAWGVSNDLKIGREGVDIYKWAEQNGKYYIYSTTNTTYEVEKLLVEDVSFGTQALLYNSPCFSFCDEEKEAVPVVKVLIVNLPENYKSGIESISFSIPEYFSDADIERLLTSIKTQ